MISTALSSVPVHYRRRLSLTVRLGTLLLTLGLLLLFFGGIITAGRLKDKPKEAVEMKETPCAYVTIQNNYRIDLLVIDYIATMQEGDTDKEDYYLAMFIDGDQKPYYCVLRADPKTALYDELRAYLADDSQYIGDARFDAYYSVHSISKITNLKEEFEKGIEKFDDLITGEVGNVSKSIYYMQYICVADEDYNAVMKAEKTGNVAAGFGMLLGAVVMIVGGILLFVKEKKKKSLPAEEQTMYQYPQQPGDPNAGVYSQQPYAAPPQNDPFYQPTAQPQQPYGTPQQGGYPQQGYNVPQQDGDPQQPYNGGYDPNAGGPETGA